MTQSGDSYETFFPAEAGIIADPYLYFQGDTWDTVLGFAVAAMPEEINGFGIVSLRDDKVWVDEILILAQQVSAIHASPDPVEIGNLMARMIEQGLDPARLLKLKWHSHVAMSVSPSVLDLETIEKSSGDWVISLIVNVHGEYSARLDVLKPYRLHPMPLEIRVVRTLPTDIADFCQREVAAKLTRSGWFRRRKSVQPHTNRTVISPAVDIVEPGKAE
jgi:hypothetical protein